MRAGLASLWPNVAFGELAHRVDQSLYLPWALVYGLMGWLVFKMLTELAQPVSVAVFGSVLFLLHPAAIYYATFLDGTLLTSFGFLWLYYELTKGKDLSASRICMPFLLLFCCGNGLFSVQLASRCRWVIGVDFSETLIGALVSRAPRNVVAVVADAQNVSFRPACFDRILFAAAVQHFSEPQVIRLMVDLAGWLKPGGILLVTDILDPLHIWRYFDSEEREALYFRRTMEETPVLGTWLDRVWMEKLARHAGFRRAQAVPRPVSWTPV